MGVAIGEIVPRRTLDWSELESRKIAVDTYNMLYQFLSNIRSIDGQPLMDSKGRVTSHLTGLLYRTANLVEKGVKPVFVFDGKPPKLKEKTREARNQIRTEAKAKFEQAQKEGHLEDARRFAAQSTRLTPEIVSSAKELVQLMGFPLVQAPSEGEAQMAFMVAKGDVYAGVSQDYDALLFGCSRLVRNLTLSGKRKVPGKNVYIDVAPEVIELETVLSELGISRQKLVWLAMLVGTDFNEKFPKIGPKTALKIVKANDSFEDIIAYTEHEPNFDYKEIEQIFLSPVHTDKYHLQFGSPQKEKIKSFLVDQHDFSADRVQNVLSKIEAKLAEKGEQSRLGDWH